MKRSLLLYNLKLNCLIFSNGLNGSLIIFIWTNTVNYRNALDRLRVRMNIILLSLVFAYIYISQGSVETHLPCSGIYNNHIIANCLQSLPVEVF